MTEKKFEMKADLTIIVTDSNSQVGDLIVHGLEEQGYQAIYERHMDALIYLKKNISPQPYEDALIISNMDSPVMGGFELLESARRIIHNIPFIFYTGVGSIDAYIDHARCSGANALVQKESPLREEGALQPLYNSIERVLRGEPFFVVRRGEGR